MKTKIDGHIFMKVWKHVTTPTLSFFSFDAAESDPSYVKVMDHTIEIDIPDDFDPRAQIVANLEAEKRKAEAEFAKRIRDLNAQIQSFLAIESGVTLVEGDPDYVPF